MDVLSELTELTEVIKSCLRKLSALARTARSQQTIICTRYTHMIIHERTRVIKTVDFQCYGKHGRVLPRGPAMVLNGAISELSDLSRVSTFWWSWGSCKRSQIPFLGESRVERNEFETAKGR